MGKDGFLKAQNNILWMIKMIKTEMILLYLNSIRTPETEKI